MAGPSRVWEYRSEKIKLRGFLGGKVDQDHLDNLLNTAGAEGWELVAGIATALYQGRTKDTVLIFKRPKSSA